MWRSPASLNFHLFILLSILSHLKKVRGFNIKVIMSRCEGTRRVWQTLSSQDLELITSAWGETVSSVWRRRGGGPGGGIHKNFSALYNRHIALFAVKYLSSQSPNITCSFQTPNITTFICDRAICSNSAFDNLAFYYRKWVCMSTSALSNHADAETSALSCPNGHHYCTMKMNQIQERNLLCSKRGHGWGDHEYRWTCSSDHYAHN